MTSSSSAGAGTRVDGRLCNRAYKARSELTVEGKRSLSRRPTLRRGSSRRALVCALHTEAVAGDPFGLIVSCREGSRG